MNFLHNLRRTCLRRTLLNPKLLRSRNVSTSNKNRETISVHTNVKGKEPQVDEKATVKRHWQSYGFDLVDEQKDYMRMYSINFCCIFFLIGGCGTVFAYYPDFLDYDWSQREAYIELRRREVLGLPLIDKNYVDPETIILPPDETLGDDDIII